VQITMPKDNVHWGNVEHRNLHNLYGALFHQATAAVRFSQLAGLAEGCGDVTMGLQGPC
jgi:hypothetical protein